jgi:aerotaxis receptor
MRNNQPVTQHEVPFPKGKYIVSRTDLKGVVTYANSTFIEISGFTSDEVIGQPHNLVRHPDMPAAAFKSLWDTVKEGRPWRGIVKNRCKNGDHYWVEALVVPVRKNNQIQGYMSVRTEPSREQVRAAEAMYVPLRSSGALPVPGRWMRIPLATKLTVMVVWLILAQILAAMTYEFGPGLGLGAGTVASILQLLGGSSIAVGIALLVLQRQIMTIMGRIVSRLDNIAQGDLTDTIPVHRVDELGKLNDSVVTMQTHLKAMMAEIDEAAGTVEEGAEAVTQKMGQTVATIHSQSDATQRIAAAVEQLLSSINEVAANADNASQVVMESDQLITVASGQMHSSREASRRVVDAVNQSGQTMSELFQSIFTIGRITQGINEISEQTNLLALNAAIEAARAGESGRGFAVVADEVRKLAEKAHKQTEEITQSIQNIQRVTQLAVSGMETAGDHVKSAEVAMGEAESGLQQIIDHGQQVTTASRLIATATHEQSNAGSEIVAQVEGIVGGIDATHAAVDDITHQTRVMRTASARLRDLIRQFRFIR